MAKKTKEVWDTVSIRPLSGVLDTRSFPEDVPLGGLRWKQNFQVEGGTKLCCRPGHDSAFVSYAESQTPPIPYTNFDWHDQGDLNGTATFQIPTMIFACVDNSGESFLYYGNQNRIATLNFTNGLLTTVASGMGGPTQSGLPSTRFKAAVLQNQVLFTNNVDQPIYSTLGTSTSSTIPDLVTLQYTAAAVIVQYRGFILMMNLMSSGQRVTSRIIWSDLNGPTTWIPSASSLANTQDLDYGDAILGAIEMAGVLYIFTQRAIWTAVIGSGTPVTNSQGVTTGYTGIFNFNKVYSEPRNGNKCLFYPNTLVSEGNSCWYGSSDGIYYYDPYTPEPVREEWLYKASSLVFGDNVSSIAQGDCMAPVAEIYPDETEIYFSWPEVSANPNGGGVNSKTLVWNYLYKSPDIVDTGYAAFVNSRPNAVTASGCPFYNVFLGASTTDGCIKEIGTVFSRAVCQNPGNGHGTVTSGTYNPVKGVYQYVGYYRILRALLPFQNFDRDKWIRRLLIEAHPSAQSNPCVLRLRIGCSYSETDPNLPDGMCSVLWHQLANMPLKCLDTMTNVQYVQKNLMRNLGTEWVTMLRGRFLYFEITIANADNSAAIGGQSCFSRIETEVRLETK